MMSRHILVAVLFSVACAPAWTASINKCVGADGKTVYQRAPCKDAVGQSQVTIRKNSTTYESADQRETREQKMSDLSSRANVQYLERKLKRIKAKIATLEKARSKELSELEIAKSVALSGPSAAENRRRYLEAELAIAKADVKHSKRLSKAYKERQELQGRLKYEKEKETKAPE